MKNLIHRRGRLRITRQLIREGKSEEILKIFSNLVIIRAEYMLMGDEIEYEALSPLFRELKTGEIEPGYEINIHNVFNGFGELVDIMIEAREIQSE